MRHPRGYLAAGLLLLGAACRGHSIDLDLPGENNPPGSGTPALALRFGGTGVDQVVDLAADPDGSVYVTGTFSGSVDFDPGTGVTTLTSIGLADIFLAKYSSTGTLVWADRIGGTVADAVTSLVRDGAGNLYLAGGFEGSADFDPGLGTLFLTSVGGEDGFVAKYTSTGALVWARRYGGTALDRVVDVAADPAGNTYAAGTFQGQADLLPAAGGQIVSNGNVADGFLLALDPSGAARWAYPIGGVESDSAAAVAVTSDGSVIVGGAFRGLADIRSGAPTLQLTSAGGSDAFLAGYTAAGTLVWARVMAGTSDEDVRAGGLAPDASGGVLVSGSFAGTTTFGVGGATATRPSLGASDWYVAAFGVGGAFQTVFTVGGVGADLAPRIAVDESGNLLVTGSFKGSVDFDPGAGSRTLTSLAVTGSDAFAASYTPAGGLLWANSFGEATAAPDRLTAGTTIIPGGQGTALLGGRFFGSPNFGSATVPFGLISFGDADGFLVRLSATGALAGSP
jgi:hypothetical protein